MNARAEVHWLNLMNLRRWFMKFRSRHWLFLLLAISTVLITFTKLVPGLKPGSVLRTYYHPVRWWLLPHVITGAIALLWSQFTQASAAEIKLAILQASTLRRKAIIPPLLNAWASYQTLAAKVPRRAV